MTGVQFEIYDFGFEMQESSDFEIPDFLIPDSRFPIPYSPDLLLQCVNPNRSAIRHDRIQSRKRLVERGFHPGRVASPPRKHGDVLLPIDLKRCRRSKNSGRRW